MKLIFCNECRDVVNLLVSKVRTCLCGQSWGQYLPDGHLARIGGKAIPLGITNREFNDALAARPKAGRGANFVAFVIAEECPTIAEHPNSPSTTRFEVRSRRPANKETP